MGTEFCNESHILNGSDIQDRVVFMFPYICKEHYGVNGIDQRHKTVTTEPIIKNY
jgi:hypothetical protein